MSASRDQSPRRAAYSLAEFAATCGRPPSWSYRLLYSGKVRAVTDLGRILIPASKLERVLSLAQPYDLKPKRDSADFLEFLGLAGLGQAEAGSLTPADIDFAADQIITYRHKTSTGFAIPIFPQVRPLLERLCERKAHDVRVFKISDAKKALTGACRRLGYPPFSQRSLRRMFITRAIERGVDVKVIAEWQGHKDGGKLILDTYSHVNRAHSQRMAALMTDQQPDNVVPMTAQA